MLYLDQSKEIGPLSKLGPSPRRWGKSTWLTATLVLALGISACGDDRDALSEGATCANSTTIAFLGRFDLPSGEHPQPAQVAAQLAVDEFNERNPKCRVELDTYTNSEGKTLGSAVTDIVDSDALAVVVANLSGDVLASAPVFENAGLGMITSTASRTDLSGQGWRVFHRIIGTNEVLGEGTSKFIDEFVRPRQVAIIDDGSPYGIDLASVVEATVKSSRISLESILDEESLTKALGDLRSFNDEDVVYFAGHEVAAAQFLTSLRDEGITTRFVGASTLPNPVFFELAGDAAEGVYSTCLCVPLSELSRGEDLQEAMNEIHDGIDANLGNAIETYDAMKTVLSVLASGSSTRDEVLDGMKSVVWRGESRNIAFDDRGENQVDEVWISIASDGAFVPVTKVRTTKDDDKGRTMIEFSFAAEPGDSVEFRTTGATGNLTYGYGQLVGSADFLGEPIDVELVGGVAYTDGSGPFTGFWTFTFSDGNTLAFDYEGRTTRTETESIIAGTLKVLGGSGRFSSVTGRGSVVGERIAEVGGGVMYHFSLDLEGLTS